jgi:hypothetical protein
MNSTNGLSFRPKVNDNFKNISPRFNVNNGPSRKKQQMIANVKQEWAAEEMKECSFRPKMSPSRSPSPRAKFPTGF